MKSTLFKLFSISILILLLISNPVGAQDISGKKVKLIIMVNTRNPLYVAYKSDGDVIAGRIFSIVMIAATGAYISGSYPPDFRENKTFQETVGKFYRHPIFKDSILNNFKPVSDYFSIDVGEDHSALNETHWDQLNKPLFKNYNFVLFIDELDAGLLTTELNTLSACTRVSIQLFDIKSHKQIDYGRFTYVHKTKRSKQEAITNREAFVNEYPHTVGRFSKRLFEDLSYSGKLHNMAQTQGLGAYVPTYEHYYKLFNQRYSLKVYSPKGWDVGTFAGSQSKFVNPRDRFEASKYVHGRVDVHKLIKDMKEEIALDKYVESYIAAKTASGYRKDETSVVDLALKPNDIQFVMIDKEGVRHLYIFRKFKEIYAVGFQFEISQDFDRYVKEYKDDIVTIMADTKVK